MQLMTNHL